MASSHKSSITTWLEKTNGFWFASYTVIMAFCLYVSIYAFRKTFAVATFEGIEYLGVSYKVWLVIAQVLGYGAAKFVGIKVISELKAASRAISILLSVSIAGVSWLFFGLIPPQYNIIFLFTNGFPLGLVWGMVFGYLEGRRFTEVLGAGLSVSFIFSAGLAKSVGGFIMRDWGVSEQWMPFAAACVFTLPLLVFLYLLDKVPPPNALDEALRTRRQPMNGEERRKFVATFLPGIIMFTLSYVLLTVFRDFRDNFSAEVWKTLGYGNSPEIFTATEVPVSFVVLIVIGSLMIVKNNQRAFMINHIIIIFGMLLTGISTFLFQQQLISAPVWMIAIGLGLYLGYVPFNSIFFDRLLAAFHYVGTVGFLIYLADSFGYLGNIGVLFFKEFGYAELSWVDFFISAGYLVSIAGAGLMTASMIYFHMRHRQLMKPEREKQHESQPSTPVP